MSSVTANAQNGDGHIAKGDKKAKRVQEQLVPAKKKVKVATAEAAGEGRDEKDGVMGDKNDKEIVGQCDEEGDDDSESSYGACVRIAMEQAGEGDGKETLNPEYWDHHFTHDAALSNQSEYLLSYSAIKPLIAPYLADAEKREKILIPGCGNCSFSDMLYDDGWHNLVSTDVSEVAIGVMQNNSRICGRTEMVWEVDDAMDMCYAEGEFDMVIDKSLLDCMYHVRASRYNSSIEHFLHESCRVTKIGGYCIFITIRNEEETLRFFGVEALNEEKGRGTSTPGHSAVAFPWTVEAQMCVVESEFGLVPIDAQGHLYNTEEAIALISSKCAKIFFMYVCRKTEKYDLMKICPDGFYFPVPDDLDTESDDDLTERMATRAASLGYPYPSSASDSEDDGDGCNHVFGRSGIDNGGEEEPKGMGMAKAEDGKNHKEKEEGIQKVAHRGPVMDEDQAEALGAAET